MNHAISARTALQVLETDSVKLTPSQVKKKLEKRIASFSMV